MRWTLVVLLVGIAAAEDQLSYPRGQSVQNFKEREFTLLIPDDFDAKKRYSLMFVVGGGTGPFTSLLSDGFIVCASRQRTPGNAGWAASEAKDLHELLDHLVKVLPIEKSRLHAAAMDDWQGFFPQVAFRKKGHRFVSACFHKSMYRGGSLPAGAKKKFRVLVLGDDGKVDEAKMVETLRGKVRSVELRADLGFHSDYVRYWLGVAEGRFEPGVDLSFAWHTDPMSARKIMAKGRGGFIYFYSKKDASQKEAKSLQHEVFFDPAVRAAGRGLVAIKLDRNGHEQLFTASKLAATPAVVVLDSGFVAVKSLEGKIKARALASALRRVSGGRLK